MNPPPFTSSSSSSSSSHPLLYIAGPYRAPTRAGVELNIQAARHTSALACLKGYAPICPHMNTAHMEEILPELPAEFWLAITMEMLRKCSAVVLVPGWTRSAGTRAEIEEAKRLRLPIYFSVLDLPEASAAHPFSPFPSPSQGHPS